MSKTYDVAVVGATGAVGETMLSILAQRKFPVGEVYALASSRSAGKRVEFGDKTLVVQDLDKFDFSKAQIGLFSAGASISEKYAPIAAEAGCVVIDNTSQFRYDDDIPLVVPEVNPHAIAEYKTRGIIANPNCSTIQMLVALKPIYDAVGIEPSTWRPTRRFQVPVKKRSRSWLLRPPGCSMRNLSSVRFIRSRSRLMFCRRSMFFWKTVIPRKR